jgi:predicted membrane metal-binding protein
VSQLSLSILLPTIFFSDTPAGRNRDMPRKIVAMKYVILFTSILVAVSGVITPIGLGQNIIFGPLVNASFDYAPDTSVFGKGTPSRAEYAESRNYNARPCQG